MVYQEEIILTIKIEVKIHSEHKHSPSRKVRPKIPHNPRPTKSPALIVRVSTVQQDNLRTMQLLPGHPPVHPVRKPRPEPTGREQGPQYIRILDHGGLQTGADFEWAQG